MSEQPFEPRPPRLIGAPEPEPDAAERGPFGERLPPRRDDDAGRGPPATAAVRPPPPEPPPPPRRFRIPLGAVAALVFAGLLAGLLVVLFIEPGIVERGAVAEEPEAPEPYAVALRASLPETPRELVPVSPIYDLRSPPAEGGVTLTLALSAPTRDVRNLGAYTWAADEWHRLGDVELVEDGAAARAALALAPDNIAILRRARFSSIVSGFLPRDEQAAAQITEALTIANPEAWSPGGDGSLLGGVSRDVARQFAPAATGAVQSIWPAVTAGLADTETVNDILADEQLRRQHVSAIHFAVQSGRYDGVDINYSRVSPALRSEFSAFITELADNLHRDDRGLSVHVPLAAGGAFGEGAYDLAVLGAAADFVIAEPPADPRLFERAAADSLPALLDRINPQRVLLALRPDAIVLSSEGFARIPQREALRLASTLSIREPGPFTAASSVTLQADSLLIENAGTGLRWDPEARMASFAYPGAGGGRVNVWIENRFSAAFKLLAVHEHGLGGVHLGSISSDPAAAFLWPAVAAFFQRGSPDLRHPNPALFTPVFSVESGILTGSASAGRQVWQLPRAPGSYEARIVVSDGDVRVGRIITVDVGG